MKVAIGCDHGGFDLKEIVKSVLKELGHEIDDQGCDSPESVDYPNFAKAVSFLVKEGKCERGILICGTGIGMSMVANKTKGVRAALCHNEYTAKMARKHNDANILCMGERVISKNKALKIVSIFLRTKFEGGRHTRRVKKIR